MIFRLLKAAKDSLYPLFERPYKGPECVVCVLGVDLIKGPNKHFDLFSDPDVSVECRHGKKAERTQVIRNSYDPRFMWSTKVRLTTRDAKVTQCYTSTNFKFFRLDAIPQERWLPLHCA